MAEKIITTEYSDEMQSSYINYAMSVITSRAVPDLRDGLKPVQRRVLYSMHTLGLNADKPTKKCARIVGDCMGKFHPHGDSSIYEALVVMSQDFKKSMPLVEGHGNFGSIEGDGAAAMRYTEARLQKFAEEVYLRDLNRDVVDFIPNYDETEKEPEVLPVRVPNFLINGSDGIAVGMTTSAPPHNLKEVLDAFVNYIENPAATVEELMQYLPGPDFPTGGIVINQSELKEIYETGKGKIKIRGKAEFVPGKRKSDKDAIVISEIPYPMIGQGVGKFMQDVADLVEKKVLTDISDIADHTADEGIKIVLELKNGADPEKILNCLFKKTKLEDTFGVNMLSIVDGRPEIVGLKRIFEESLKFQLELSTRRYRNLLDKELKKKEVEEGLIEATNMIETIVEIVLGSKKVEYARECLMTGNTDSVKFKTEEAKKRASRCHFTEAQTQAILDLTMRKLVGLEILELKKSYKETLEKIAEYNLYLSSDTEMKKVIVEDLKAIGNEYDTPRKTALSDAEEAVYEEPEEVVIPVVYTMNRFGYTKLYDVAFYEKNRDAIAEEAVRTIFTMSNAKLWLFTDSGLMHQIKMKDVPLSKLKDKGVPIDNISGFDSGKEQILLLDSEENLKVKTLLFVSEGAMIKQVLAEEFLSVKKTISATKLNDNDRLAYVGYLTGEATVLVTNEHNVLMFPSDEISLYKKTSVGVRGLKLGVNEKITNVYDIDPSIRSLVKIGKKTVDLSKLKMKKRDGKPERIQ